MIERPHPRTAFEYAERGWRVYLAWVIGIPLGLFFVAVLTLIVAALARAIVTGQDIPNLTGGLDRLLTPFAPYIAGGFGALLSLVFFRHREVTSQIRAGGGQDRPPFTPSSPPYSAGDPRPEEGPRPNDSPGAST